MVARLPAAVRVRKASRRRVRDQRMRTGHVPSHYILVLGAGGHIQQPTKFPPILGVLPPGAVAGAAVWVLAA